MTVPAILFLTLLCTPPRVPLLRSMDASAKPKGHPSIAAKPKGHPRRSKDDAFTTNVFFALVGLSFVFIVASIFSKVTPKGTAVVKGSLEAIQRAAVQRHKYTLRALDDQQDFAASDVLIAAHRGCHGRFPENSLGAIAACAEEGAQLAEVDVQLTADGQLVLIHDKSPVRVANAQKSELVSQLTLAELKRLWLVQRDASGSSTPFKIPTLVEAIEVAAACGIVLIIDPKLAKLEKRVLEDIHATDGWDHVILGHNFNPAVVRQLASQVQPSDRPSRRLRSVVRLASRNAVRQACAAMGVESVYCNVTMKPRASTTSFKAVRPEVAMWMPTKDAKHDFGMNCDLRRAGRGPAFNFLWEYGEFHIRDPKRVNELWNLSNASLELNGFKPCLHARLQELPCFGAHLFIPLLKVSCSRVAVTDMPSALRAALLAFDMAPATATAAAIAAGRELPLSWPIDAPKLPAHPSVAHQLPPSPKCLDLVTGATGEEPHFAPTATNSARRKNSPNAAMHNGDLVHVMGHLF